MKPSARSVLQLLRARGARGVTALDALDEAGTFRLSGRILELRREGYPVRTTWERTPNGARIARYVLVEDEAA